MLTRRSDHGTRPQSNGALPLLSHNRSTTWSVCRRSAEHPQPGGPRPTRVASERAEARMVLGGAPSTRVNARLNAASES
jgi:hypothetical protein